MKRFAGLANTMALAMLLFGAHAAHATMIDLTTPGASGILNGAIFQQTSLQPTGTGAIHSFAQIGKGNRSVVHGYNTTVNKVFDNGSSDNFNRSITVGMIPVVSLDGMDYYQFLLDINESKGGLNPYLSLDEVQIFVGGPANPSSTTFDSNGILQGVGRLVYDMENNAGNWVALNYALNSGSGSGDMFLYVPTGNFGGAASDAVVTLYSRFGGQGLNPEEYGEGNFGNSAGFEEWALLQGEKQSIVPEPATLSLIGLGLAGFAVRQVARRRCAMN